MATTVGKGSEVSDEARARMVDARDRALAQLSSMLPSPDEVVVLPTDNRAATAEPTPHSLPELPPAIPTNRTKRANGKTKPAATRRSTDSHAQKTEPDKPEQRPTTSAATWVPVAVAAKKLAVDPTTIRSWYRAGEIATRRKHGDRGPVLVPLDEVFQRAARNGHHEKPEQTQPTPADLAATAEVLTGTQAPPDVELLATSGADGRTAEVEDLRQQLDEERRRRVAAERERDEAQAEITNLNEQIAELEDHLTSPLSWSLDELAKRPGYRGRWARGAREDADDLVPATAGD